MCPHSILCFSLSLLFSLLYVIGILIIGRRPEEKKGNLKGVSKEKEGRERLRERGRREEGRA